MRLRLGMLYILRALVAGTEGFLWGRRTHAARAGLRGGARSNPSHRPALRAPRGRRRPDTSAAPGPLAAGIPAASIAQARLLGPALSAERHQGGQQHARERPERALQPVSGAGRRVRGHAGLHRARQTPAEVCRGGGERCSQKLRLGARELSAWPRWREQCQRPRSIARRVCSSSQGACTHTTVCGLVSPGGQQRGFAERGIAERACGSLRRPAARDDSHECHCKRRAGVAMAQHGKLGRGKLWTAHGLPRGRRESDASPAQTRLFLRRFTPPAPRHMTSWPRYPLPWTKVAGNASWHRSLLHTHVR